VINVNEVYQDIHSIAAKQQHGAPSPEDFDRYANLANIDLYNYYVEPIKDYYQLGKAIPKRSVGLNKVIDQALRPFFTLFQPRPVVSGQAHLDINVEYIDAVTSTYEGKQVPIKWIPFDKVADYQNSTIDEPTPAYPVYTDAPSSIFVYPSDTPSVYLSYLKTPVTVHWGYSIVSGRPVYNLSTSVDFEWAPVQKRDLIARICKYLGMSIRDQDLEQFGLQEENTTS
jgi:hypothetical protein